MKSACFRRLTPLLLLARGAMLRATHVASVSRQDCRALFAKLSDVEHQLEPCDDGRRAAVRLKRDSNTGMHKEIIYQSVAKLYLRHLHRPALGAKVRAIGEELTHCRRHSADALRVLRLQVACDRVFFDRHGNWAVVHPAVFSTRLHRQGWQGCEWKF